MKISQVFLIGLVLSSLALLCSCTETSPAPTNLISTPSSPQIAGIQIGYSTQDDLEHSWGEGLTVTGGHPNSGRRWRIRNTDRSLATDGFLYSDRGLVIDSLQIDSQQTDPLSINAPIAKLDKDAFAWRA